jgi:hypothetical protein
MKRNRSSISKAGSYEEIGEYWDDHDVSDFWKRTRRVKFDVVLEREANLLPGGKGAVTKDQIGCAQTGNTLWYSRQSVVGAENKSGESSTAPAKVIRKARIQFNRSEIKLLEYPTFLQSRRSRAGIIEDLEAALEQFREIAADLGSEEVMAEKIESTNK